MEKATHHAANRVNQHREDGEEAIKRTSKVVPIDSGKGRESVQTTTDSKSPQEGKSTREDQK